MTEPRVTPDKNRHAMSKSDMLRSLLLARRIGQALGSQDWIKDRRTSRPRMTPLQKTGCTAYCRNNEQRG